MASCDIQSILTDFNKIIDTSVKGNADSITQLENGNFQIAWGEQFKVKDRPQALHMAEQKVDSAHKALDKEGFNSKVFGPYLNIDAQEGTIFINRLEPTRLTRALEIRNHSEDQAVGIGEIITDGDRELLHNEPEVPQVIEKFETIDPSEVVPEALTHADEIKNDIYKGMFTSQPEEFLKFVAEQFWSTYLSAFESEEKGVGNIHVGRGTDAFPDSIISAAKRLYPKELFIQRNDLPPIQPECI